MSIKIDYMNEDPSVCVGEYVYRPYEPQNIGRITKLASNETVRGYAMFEVRWMRPQKDGSSVGVYGGHHLNSLQALIDDHKKKARTHTKALEEAKKKLED